MQWPILSGKYFWRKIYHMKEHIASYREMLKLFNLDFPNWSYGKSNKNRTPTHTHTHTNTLHWLYTMQSFSVYNAPQLLAAVNNITCYNLTRFTHFLHNVNQRSIFSKIKHIYFIIFFRQSLEVQGNCCIMWQSHVPLTTPLRQSKTRLVEIILLYHSPMMRWLLP